MLTVDARRNGKWEKDCHSTTLDAAKTRADELFEQADVQAVEVWTVDTDVLQYSRAK